MKGADMLSKLFRRKKTRRSARLVRMGKTSRAIRGAYTYSYTDRGHDFYKYGE
jgi:hypothetical protein